MPMTGRSPTSSAHIGKIINNIPGKACLWPVGVTEGSSPLGSLKKAETTAGTTVSLAYPLTMDLCKGGTYKLSPDLFNAELSVFGVALAGTRSQEMPGGREKLYLTLRRGSPPQ